MNTISEQDEREAREWLRALEADGEKLRSLTGEDHGPAFVADDLVKRLRHAHEHEGIDIERVMHEAADRIEALEKALRQLADNKLSDDNCASVELAGRRVAALARRALEAK